jgi:histidyl-tRNA synthetase
LPIDRTESQIVKPKLKIMASKPSILKGTRDFSPAEVAKRQYIIQIIKNNF